MRIMVAEDDAVSRTLLEATLTKWGHEVVSCVDGIAALNKLREKDAPQLAILDWMMPGMTGPEVCQKVRQLGGEPYIYVILLTSKNTRGDLLEGMDAGADEYLTKPFDQAELMVRLNAGIRILDLQTQLIDMREELRVQATRDGLTNLWNQTEILRLLSNEVRRSKRLDAVLSLMFFDIDHFKLVNDTWGHTIGDIVIAEIANRMRSSIREYDMLGRFGGEEFLVVLPECNSDSAMKAAERMLKSVEEAPIKTEKGDVFVTISIGVASNSSDKNMDAEELIKVADTGMYLAKRSGRNCVRYASNADPAANLLPTIPTP